METFRQLGLPVDQLYYGVKVGVQMFVVGTGLFSNLYTVFCVMRRSKLGKVTNMFIVGISLALVVQALNAAIDFANHWADRRYYIWDPEWCKAWQVMNTFLPSMFALLCFFAILDIERLVGHIKATSMCHDSKESKEYRRSW